MEFLRVFIKQLKNIFLSNKRVPQPYREINPSEQITRFLSDKKHYDKSRDSVNPSAFIPRTSDKGKLSVIRINKINTEEEIFEIDKAISPPTRTGSSKFRADFNAEIVLRENLNLVPDISNNQHLRHALISGFSMDDSGDLIETLVLAKNSKLIKKP